MRGEIRGEDGRKMDKPAENMTAEEDYTGACWGKEEIRHRG